MQDPVTGILKPEVALRMAQADVDELRIAVLAADDLLEKLKAQLQHATLAFAALVLQHGGEATITQEEMRAVFTMQRKVDPATKALTYKVTRREDPRGLVAVE
jgi:hypothetical protein